MSSSIVTDLARLKSTVVGRKKLLSICSTLIENAKYNEDTVAAQDSRRAHEASLSANSLSKGLKTGRYLRGQLRHKEHLLSRSEGGTFDIADRHLGHTINSMVHGELAELHEKKALETNEDQERTSHLQAATSHRLASHLHDYTAGRLQELTARAHVLYARKIASNPKFWRDQAKRVRAHIHASTKDPSEQGFVQAIRKNPEDSTHKRVYSDWLRDRGLHTAANKVLKGVSDES